MPGLLRKYSNKGNVQFAMLMYTLHQKYADAFSVHTLTAEEMATEEASYSPLRCSTLS